MGHLDVGPADRLHVGLGERLAVAARHGVLDDLVEQGLAAEPRLEQPGRRLSRAEPGQPNLLGQLLVGPLKIGFQLGERHLHVDANPGGAQLRHGALHGVLLGMSFLRTAVRLAAWSG